MGKEDPHPYAIVQVAGYAVRGLLDSGASVSLLEKRFWGAGQ